MRRRRTSGLARAPSGWRAPLDTKKKTRYTNMCNNMYNRPLQLFNGCQRRALQMPIGEPFIFFLRFIFFVAAQLISPVHSTLRIVAKNGTREWKFCWLNSWEKKERLSPVIQTSKEKVVRIYVWQCVRSALRVYRKGVVETAVNMAGMVISSRPRLELEKTGCASVSIIRMNR